jgi:hypothetical protein
MTYEILDRNGKRISVIVKRGKEFPERELNLRLTDYHLRVGEEGPYTEATSIRRLK